MKIVSEFRQFIEQGRVMDLAIAVVMGGAFNAIVSSVVKDLIMPLLSLITRGTSFSDLAIPLGSGPDAAQLTYGNFIGAVVHFILVAIVIFLLIKLYNRFAEKKVAQPPATKKCPYCTTAIGEAAVRCPSCTTVLDVEKVPVALR